MINRKLCGVCCLLFAALGCESVLASLSDSQFEIDVEGLSNNNIRNSLYHDLRLSIDIPVKFGIDFTGSEDIKLVDVGGEQTNVDCRTIRAKFSWKGKISISLHDGFFLRREGGVDDTGNNSIECMALFSIEDADVSSGHNIRERVSNKEIYYNSEPLVVDWSPGSVGVFVFSITSFHKKRNTFIPGHYEGTMTIVVTPLES
jgi:hypothetical protein